ncbi:MAG: hypothetical protein F6K10_13550, partial [Moorea sp. SIO2B7]|nr:hypothetical protein [Moorena sp. SIO2B7]
FILKPIYNPDTPKVVGTPNQIKNPIIGLFELRKTGAIAIRIRDSTTSAMPIVTHFWMVFSFNNPSQ